MSIDWDYGVNVTIDHGDQMSRTATPTLATIVSLYKLFHRTLYWQTHLLALLLQFRPDIRIQMSWQKKRSGLSGAKSS